MKQIIQYISFFSLLLTSCSKKEATNKDMDVLKVDTLQNTVVLNALQMKNAGVEITSLSLLKF